MIYGIKAYKLKLNHVAMRLGRLMLIVSGIRQIELLQNISNLTVIYLNLTLTGVSWLKFCTADLPINGGGTAEAAYPRSHCLLKEVLVIRPFRLLSGRFGPIPGHVIS
jgi:hypothetical protein